LECPVTSSAKAINKTGPALKTDKRALRFLKESGFDAVTLANNHIMDYGSRGLADTISGLEEFQIKYAGADENLNRASKPLRIEKEGVKVSILNFAENEWSTTYGESYGANPSDPIHCFNRIQAEKKHADHIIVIHHGGHEMYELPSPEMVKGYRFFVDAGANAVINTHTHCISGKELYKGAPIYYSIGNFLFDRKEKSKSFWNHGLAVSLSIGNDNIVTEEYFFEQCVSGPRLNLLKGPELSEFKEYFEGLSEKIRDEKKIEQYFEDWVNRKENMYRSYIEPHGIKYLNSLQIRNILPSFWTARKKTYLLNLIRCESHREMLIKILERDYCHTQK
jgi:hypothetical protein